MRTRPLRRVRTDQIRHAHAAGSRQAPGASVPDAAECFDAAASGDSAERVIRRRAAEARPTGERRRPGRATGARVAPVPELPEVEALVGFLRERARGRFVTRVDVAAINALKTFDPPPSALVGLEVEDVARHGKFLDLQVGGLHLVIHLSRAGLGAVEGVGAADPGAPGQGSARAAGAVRRRQRPGRHRGRHPEAAGGLRRARPGRGARASRGSGPTRWPTDFTRDVFAALLAEHGRAQVKGVLRTQSVIAGIGNAYSDEILHAARISPFHPAGTFDEEEVDRLYAALREVLGDAVERSRGLPAGELKDDKRAAMRVHGRAGQACPVCGDTVREVSFSDRSLQYCPTCQTGGKLLADRRMSRLLK